MLNWRGRPATILLTAGALVATLGAAGCATAASAKQAPPAIQAGNGYVPTPITPGEVYEYKINVWPTSNLYGKGHKIRLEISSSDYPQFAPNPNTGEPFGASAAIKVATQTILHDPAHASSVILPMISAGASGEAFDHPPAR